MRNKPDTDWLYLIMRQGLQKREIKIVSAGSILGLKPSGVEGLPDALISNGLVRSLNAGSQIITVKNYNNLYSIERDKRTCILNGDAQIGRASCREKGSRQIVV